MIILNINLFKEYFNEAHTIAKAAHIDFLLLKSLTDINKGKSLALPKALSVYGDRHFPIVGCTSTQFPVMIWFEKPASKMQV